MKITVFGASGKTGQQVVNQALELGFEVKAFVRRDNAIETTHPQLEVIVGLLDDEEKMRMAIHGSDACISTLGGKSLSKHSSEIINGIQLICKIMEEEKVDRLLYLSSVGASESYYFMQRLVRFMVIDLMLRVPIADHTTNEKTIRASKLNYTIIRPGTLNDGSFSAKIVSGVEKTVFKGNPQISRASVAGFILQGIKNADYNKQAVWLFQEK